MVLFLAPQVFAGEVGITPSELDISENTGLIYEKDLNLNINSANETEVVQITADIPFFESQVNPGSIISTNETKTYPIHFSLVIPEHFSPGNYTGTLFVASNEAEIDVPIEIEILPCSNFTVEMERDIVLNTGTSGRINGTIKNTGNRNIPLDVSSNSTIFSGTNFTSFKQAEQYFYVNYLVPLNCSTGIRAVNFSFNERDYSVNLTVRDDISPEIELLSVEDVSVAKDFTILAESSDNIAVRKVYSDMNCTHRSERNNFTKVGTEWRGEIKGFDQPQECDVEICALDTSGNMKCVGTDFSVTYLKDFVVWNELDLLKFKPGFERKIQFIDSEEFVNVSVELKNLTFVDFSNNEYNFSSSGLEVYVGTENQRKQYSEIGEKISIESKEFMIYVKGSQEGRIEGVLGLEIPKGYVTNRTQDVAFLGRIDIYNTYPPFSGERMDYEIDCKVVDTGSQSTSYTTCNLKTAEGAIEDPKKMSFPISAEALQDKELKYEQQIEEKEDTANAYLLAFAIMVAMWLVTMMFLIYRFYIVPME